jgi:hypothetical protein
LKNPILKLVYVSKRKKVLQIFKKFHHLIKRRVPKSVTSEIGGGIAMKINVSPIISKYGNQCK